MIFRRRPPDPEALFAEIAAAHPGRKYSKLDRYKDFRQLFLGSDQGRRVLYEIFSWCNMYRMPAPIARFDTNETFFHEGERNIGLRILAAMHAEPSERPKSTKEE